MRDSAAVTPSDRPSVRYVSAVSCVAFVRGRTATELRCVSETDSHPIIAVATTPLTTDHNTRRTGRRRAERRGVAASANGVWRVRIAWMRAAVSGEGVASYSFSNRRRNVSKVLSAPARSPDRSRSAVRLFFFKQKTAYEVFT